jgi:hypothetical protein
MPDVGHSRMVSQCVDNDQIPLGCIHSEEIAATVRYKDHTGKRHILDMRPK